MRPTFFAKIFIFLFSISFIFLSCKKENVTTENISAIKTGWITSGTWKVKDLVLAYPVNLGTGDLPVGFSVYNLTPYLPVSGPVIDSTKTNTYTFNADKSYVISGNTKLLLPIAGNAGKWQLEIYDAVLRVTATDKQTAPYWTNNITATNWSIGLTIYLVEADANLPVNLLLEK